MPPSDGGFVWLLVPGTRAIRCCHETPGDGTCGALLADPAAAAAHHAAVHGLAPGCRAFTSKSVTTAGVKVFTLERCLQCAVRNDLTGNNAGSNFQQGHVKRHLVAPRPRKTWTCSKCGKEFTSNGTNKAHLAKCSGSG